MSKFSLDQLLDASLVNPARDLQVPMAIFGAFDLAQPTDLGYSSPDSPLPLRAFLNSFESTSLGLNP